MHKDLDELYNCLIYVYSMGLMETLTEIRPQIHQLVLYLQRESICSLAEPESHTYM